MAKQRQAWLDYVRFFSIFLVIVFHTPPRLPLLDNAVVLNLRVPVFFCISGFLYSIDRWSSFKQYALHRSKQIVVPYVTFFLIFYPLWLVVGRRLGDPKVVLPTFWYLSCLYAMQLLYYWVERLVPRRWVMAATVLLSGCAFVAFELQHSRIEYAWWRFWNVGNALRFMPFYALGNCFKRQLSALSFTSWRTVAGYAVLALLSVVGMAAVAPLDTSDNPLYMLCRIPAGLMVIPAFFGVAKWLAARLGHSKVVEFVTVSGTVYLGLQNYFIDAAKLLLTRVCGAGYAVDHAWLKLVIAVAVMAAIYPVAWLVDRYTPWLIGKGKYFDKY